MTVMIANRRPKLELLKRRLIEVGFIVEASLADITKWVSRCWYKPCEIVVSLPNTTNTYDDFCIARNWLYDRCGRDPFHYPIQGTLAGIYWLALRFSRIFYNHSTF